MLRIFREDKEIVTLFFQLFETLMKQDRSNGGSNISSYETSLALHRNDSLSVVKLAYYLHGENDEDIRCLGRAIMRDLITTGGMAALESIRYKQELLALMLSYEIAFSHRVAK